MASFNLTAELNLRGPSNLNQVVSNIRKQLSTISLNLNINPATSKGIQSVTAEVKNLSAALRDAQTNAVALSTTLRGLGASVSSFASSTSTISSNFGSISGSASGTTTAIKAVSSEMTEFGKQSALAIRRFAAFSVATGAIYSLSRAITSAYGEFVTFNKEFVRLQQVTESSASSLTSLSNEITRLSTSFGVSSSELLQVSVTLAQAGLSAGETKVALEALAKSALAPSFDSLNDTVEGSIALMRQFGISSADLESSLGSVNAVAAKFAVEAGDIIAAIQRTGGVFAAASKGVSEGKDALNEFLAVFTSVRATTRESAETIATGLRTIFTRIQRGSTIEALKQYGVTLTDLEGKFVGPFEAVKRLSEGLKGLDTRDLRYSKIVEELGGFRQIGKVIPLIQQFESAQKALGVAQAGTGSLARDAATAQEALSVRINKVREQFVGLIRDIGQSQGFQTFVDVSLKLAGALISVADAAKDVLPAIAAIAAVRGVGALGQFFGGFSSGVGNRRPKGFAKGGVVPGSGRGDKVPALLEPGEVVMSNVAVNRYGRGNLVRMNQYARGGPVKASQLKSATIKNRVKSANSDIDPEEFRSGNYITDSDLIYFDKTEYGVKAAKNISYAKFEDRVGEKIGGKPLYGNAPIDIPKNKLGRPIEVRNRKETTKNPELLDKLLRYNLQTTGSLISNQKQKDNNLYAGKIGVAYNTSKLQRSRFTSLNMGGEVQKFNRGGLSEAVKPKAALSPQDLIIGPGHLKSGEWRATLRSLILQNGLATDLDMRNLMVDEQKISLSQAFSPRQLASSKLQQTLGGPENIAKLEKLREDAVLAYRGKRSGVLEANRTRSPDEVSAARKGSVLFGAAGMYGNRFPPSEIRFGQTEGLKQDTKAIVFGSLLDRNVEAKQKRLQKRKIMLDAAGVPGGVDAGSREIQAAPTSRGLSKIFGSKGVSKANKALALDRVGAIAKTLSPQTQGSQIFLDFDRTLAFGSDKIGPKLNKKAPDYSAFGDPKQVSGGLAKAKLSGLGIRLKKLVANLDSKSSGLGNELLKRMFVISARPPQTMSLISKWLADKGLRIPAGNVSGVGGPGLGSDGVAIAKAEKMLSMAGPGSVFIDDDPKNISTAREKGISSIQYGSSGTKKSRIQDAQQEGLQFEQFINEQLPVNLKSGILGPDKEGMDFPLGLGNSIAKYWFNDSRLSNIPVDTKRTLTGPRGKIKNNILSYLKQQGYNSGGMVQKMAAGSYARGKKGAKGARGPKGFKPLGDVEYQKWANSIYDRYDKDPSLPWSSHMDIPMPPEIADYHKKVSRYALETGGAGLAIGKDSKGFEVIAKFARVKAQKAIASGKLKKTQGALTFSAAGLERGPKAPAGQMEKTLAQYQQDPQYRTAMGLDSGVSGGFLKQFETLSKSKNFTSPKTLLDKLPGAKSKILEFRASLQQQLKTATDPKEIKSLQDQIKKSTTALDDFDSYVTGGSPKNSGRASHFAWSMRQAVPDAARYNLGGSSQNNVQALLTPGEAVIDPGLAKKIGKSKLDQMNYADKNKTRGYSKGGGVSIVPGSGNGDTFGPVPLPVGSYVIRKKATEALGFNRGGQVGGIQRFAAGGSSLPARPTTSTVFNTVVPPGTVQALQEMAKALENMGISASESARILSQGGSISVAAAEKAYQADLNRLRIAGASASDIYNAEQRLADVRNKNAAKIKTENLFSGKTGSELQDIQTKAEKMRASKIENTRASYAASGLSEDEIKVKMADPSLQDKIREQSYRRAAGSPAGVGGGDIEQYVNQSMMDTSTLKQMDKQLLAQRRAQLAADKTYGSASKAQQRQMMKELDARTKEEIAARRDIVTQLRKDKGLGSGFLGRQGAGLSRMAGMGQTGMALFGMGELREDAFGDGKRGRGFAKGFSNMSRGMMGAGMGLTFAGGMIGDTAGKAIGGKEGAAFSAAVSAIIGPVGIGMMFGPLGAFAGLVVGATSALDAWKNSIIDANIEELKKKDEKSNADIQNAMSNLSKSSNKDASTVIQGSNSAFEAIANRQNKIQSELMTKIIPGEVGSSMPTGLKWLPKTFQALTGYRDTGGNLLNPADQKIVEAEKELVSSAKDTDILSTLPARFEAGLAKGLSVQEVEASFGPGQLDSLKKLFATAQGNPAILALLTQRELKVRKKEDTSDIDKTIKRISDLSFEDNLSKPLKDREKSERDVAQAMAGATVEVNLLNLALNKIGSASRKAAVSFEEVQRQIATQQSVMFGGQIQGVDRSQEDVLGNLLSYSVNEIRDVVSRITTGLDYNPELSEELQDAVVSQKIIQQELPKILAEVGAREQDSFNEESGSAELIRKQLELAFIPIQPDAVKRKTSIDEIIKNIEKRLGNRKGVTVKELAEDSSLLNTAATREADPTKDLQDSLKQNNDTIDSLRKNIDVFVSELVKASDMRIAAENQRIESANQLNAALGGELSLEDMNRSFNNTLSQLTSEIGADLKPIAGTGTSDPQVIMDRMAAQETIVREDLAKQEEIDPKDIGGEEWTKLTESIRRARLEASNLGKAHLKLQTDTTRLSNALNRIAEQRQVEQSKQGSFLDFLKNVNNPEAMFEFQNETGSFLAQMAGQGTMMGLPAAIAGLERKLAVVTKPEGDKIREQFLTEAANMLKQQRDAFGQPRFDQGTIDGILENIGVGPRENPEMQRLIDEFNSVNSIYIEAMKQSSDLLRSAAQDAAAEWIAGAKQVVEIQRSAAQEPASKRIPLVPQENIPQGRGFPGAQQFFQEGGVVYASGGKYINYQPRGTDTVPAMLSPGEFVVNARATKNNMGLLKSINNGSKSRGSNVNLNYFNEGGLVSPDLKSRIAILYDDVDSENITEDDLYDRLKNGGVPLIANTEDQYALLDFKDAYERRKRDQEEVSHQQQIANQDKQRTSEINARKQREAADASVRQRDLEQTRTQLAEARKQSEESRARLEEIRRQDEERRSGGGGDNVDPLERAAARRRAVDSGMAFNVTEEEKLASRRRRFPEIAWSRPKTEADLASIAAGTNAGVNKSQKIQDLFDTDPLFKDYRYNENLASAIKSKIAERYSDDLDDQMPTMSSLRSLASATSFDFANQTRASAERKQLARQERNRAMIASATANFVNNLPFVGDGKRYESAFRATYLGDKSAQLHIKDSEKEGAELQKSVGEMVEKAKNGYEGPLGMLAYAGDSIVSGITDTQSVWRDTGPVADIKDRMNKYKQKEIKAGNTDFSWENHTNPIISALGTTGRYTGELFGGTVGSTLNTVGGTAMISAAGYARAFGFEEYAKSFENKGFEAFSAAGSDFYRAMEQTGRGVAGLGERAMGYDDPTQLLKGSTQGQLLDERNVQEAGPLGTVVRVAQIVRDTAGESTIPFPGLGKRGVPRSIAGRMDDLDPSLARQRQRSIPNEGVDASVFDNTNMGGMNFPKVKFPTGSGSNIRTRSTFGGAEDLIQEEGVRAALARMSSVKNKVSGYTKKGWAGAGDILGKGTSGVGDILGKGKAMASGALGKGKAMAPGALDLGKRAGSSLIGFGQTAISPILQPFKTLSKIKKKLLGNDYHRQLKKTRVGARKKAKAAKKAPKPTPAAEAAARLQEQTKNMPVTRGDVFNQPASSGTIDKAREMVAKAQEEVREIMVKYASSPEKAQELLNKQDEIFNIRGLNIDPKIKTNINALTGTSGSPGQFDPITRQIGIADTDDLTRAGLIRHELGHGIQDNLSRMQFGPNSPDPYKHFRQDHLKSIQPQIDKFTKKGGAYEKLIKDSGGQAEGTGFYPPNAVSTGHQELFTSLIQGANTDAFKNNKEAQDMLRSVIKAMGYKKGGVVYASNGTLVPYQPRGTDTVPAMLTPGEFVVNARAAKNNMGLLKSINGGAKGYSKGGVAYLEGGGRVRTRKDLEEEIEAKKTERKEIESKAKAKGKEYDSSVFDVDTPGHEGEGYKDYKKQLNLFRDYAFQDLIGFLSNLPDGPENETLNANLNEFRQQTAERYAKMENDNVSKVLFGNDSKLSAQESIDEQLKWMDPVINDFKSGKWNAAAVAPDSLEKQETAFDNVLGQKKLIEQKRSGYTADSKQRLFKLGHEIKDSQDLLRDIDLLQDKINAQNEARIAYHSVKLTLEDMGIDTTHFGGEFTTDEIDKSLESPDFEAKAEQNKARAIQQLKQIAEENLTANNIDWKTALPELKPTQVAPTPTIPDLKPNGDIEALAANAEFAKALELPLRQGILIGSNGSGGQMPPIDPKVAASINRGVTRDDLFPGLLPRQPETPVYGPQLPSAPPSRDELAAIGSFVGGGLGQLRLPVSGAETPEEDPYANMNPRQKMLAMRKAEYQASQKAKRESFRTSTGRDPATGQIGGAKTPLTEEQKTLNRKRAEIRAKRSALDTSDWSTMGAEIELEREFEKTLSPEQMANRERVERLALGAVDPKKRTEFQQERYEANQKERLEGLSPEQKANRERTERIAIVGVSEQTPEQQEKLDLLRIPMDERTPEQIARLEELRLERSKLIYASKGRFVNFQPRGSDTVPAMLTPGEFVVNRRATRQNMGLLKAINKGQNVQPIALNRGGIVSPQYYDVGGGVSSGSSGGGGVSNISVDSSSLDAAFSNFGTHVGSLSSIVDSFVQGSSSLDGLSQAIGSLGNLGLTEGASLMANAGTSVKEATTAFSSAMTAFNTAASSLSTAIGTIPTSIALTVSGSIPITVSVQIEGDTGSGTDTTILSQSIMDKVGLAINAATQGGISIDTAIS
jgi:TP901 family phage tail tape measure protein